MDDLRFSPKFVSGIIETFQKEYPDLDLARCAINEIRGKALAKAYTHDRILLIPGKDLEDRLIKASAEILEILYERLPSEEREDLSDMWNKAFEELLYDINRDKETVSRIADVVVDNLEKSINGGGSRAAIGVQQNDIISSIQRTLGMSNDLAARVKAELANRSSALQPAPSR